MPREGGRVRRTRQGRAEGRKNKAPEPLQQRRSIGEDKGKGKRQEEDPVPRQKAATARIGPRSQGRDGDPLYMWPG